MTLEQLQERQANDANIIRLCTKIDVSLGMINQGIAQGKPVSIKIDEHELPLDRDKKYELLVGLKEALEKERTSLLSQVK